MSFDDIKHDNHPKFKSTTEEDVLLYDDLHDAKLPAVRSFLAPATPTTTTNDHPSHPSHSILQLQQQQQQQQHRPLSFSQQVQELQQRVQMLEQENETLKRNIGTLYRTAKRELSRKDQHIQRLESELDQTKVSPTPVVLVQRGGPRATETNED